MKIIKSIATPIRKLLASLAATGAGAGANLIGFLAYDGSAKVVQDLTSTVAGKGADLIIYPVSPLETASGMAVGVDILYPKYPVGDVRRYGVFADGATNWEFLYGTRMNRIKVLATKTLVSFLERGIYYTGWNLASAYSGSRYHITPGAEFGNIFHVISGGGATDPYIDDVTISGTLTTYDRFGVQYASNIRVDRVVLKSDPTKNTLGTKGRGCHISAGATDVEIRSLIIEDCGNDINSDAALAIDGAAARPKQIKIGRVWIKNSDVNGAYICGSSHTIGEMRIDAFGALSASKSAEDSDGAAQCNELKGVWFNRCWDVEVGTLKVNQNVGDARANDLYHVLVDETGVTNDETAGEKGIRIGSLICDNVRRRGVSFGDRNFAAANSINFIADLIAITPPNGVAVDAGYALMHLNQVTGDTRVKVEKLEFINAGTSTMLSTASGTKFHFGQVNTRTHSTALEIASGTVIDAQGVVVGEYVDIEYNTGSAAGPVVNFSGAGASGSEVKKIRGKGASAGGVNTPFFRADTVDRLKIGEIYTTGFYSSSGNGCVQLNNITASYFGGLHLVAPSVFGNGLWLNGLTDCHLENITITGFATGVHKVAAAALTRCSVINANVSGNTANTDVPNGALASLNQTNFTL